MLSMFKKNKARKKKKLINGERTNNSQANRQRNSFKYKIYTVTGGDDWYKQTFYRCNFFFFKDHRCGDHKNHFGLICERIFRLDHELF